MKEWFTTNAQRILLYFINNIKKEHHLRELANLMEMDPGNLSREMGRLSQMGLFKVRTKGRLKLYTLNTNHPLYKEIRGLLLKTQGAPLQIRQALQTFPNIEQAFLYGSFAAGKLDEKSDVDLMIIGKVDHLKLAEALRPIEMKLGREIHFRTLNQEEYLKRSKEKDPFIMSVKRGKTIPLIGGK
jgi:predicted nucleotidyltransferase